MKFSWSENANFQIENFLKYHSFLIQSLHSKILEIGDISDFRKNDLFWKSWYEHSRKMIWTKRRLRLKIRIDLYNLWVAWLCLNWKIEYLFCIGCYRAIFRIDRGVETLLISAYDNLPRRAFRVLQKWQKWLKRPQMTFFISKWSHSTTGQFLSSKKAKNIWALIMLFMGGNIKSIGQNCEFHKKLFWNDSFLTWYVIYMTHSKKLMLWPFWFDC